MVLALRLQWLLDHRTKSSCFLRGLTWPPSWSSGQSSWLHMQRSGCSIPGTTRFSDKLWVWNGVHSASWVHLRNYLEEKSSVSSLGNRESGLGIRNADHVQPSMLALTSLTIGGRLVGIVLLRTKATELLLLLLLLLLLWVLRAGEGDNRRLDNLMAKNLVICSPLLEWSSLEEWDVLAL
jgi:hypothetical protein